MKRLSLIKVTALLLFLGVSVVSFAQQKVSGVVKDAAGVPVIGAGVVVEGTQIGTITDMDGAFSFSVPDKSTLVISCVGYKEVKVEAGKAPLNIKLEEDALFLDDVVVIGYGTVKKRDLTGAVASVKDADLKKVASANVLQSLQAKVPGVDLTQSDGQAGSSISMTIRGNRSISASNSPLILVDGVEYGSTMDIPATDIESIDILKDASSTAIYGTKGANGVILITTKRGKSGKTYVNFNMYESFNSPTAQVKGMYGEKEVQRFADRLNWNDDLATGNWGSANHSALEYFGTSALADGTTMASIVQDGSYTDWYDYVVSNSLTQNYELSVNGGNDKTNFNTSLAFMDDKGLLKGDEMKRYKGRINLDHKINSWAKVGMSMDFTYKDHGSRNSSVYSQIRKMTTITHAYLNDGSINAKPNPLYDAHCNPLLDEVDGAYQKNVETSRILGNVYAQITPFKGFSFKTLFSVDRKNVRTGIYQDYQSVARYQAPATTSISNNQAVTTGFVWQNTINYNFNIEQKHDFAFMLGHEMSQSVYEYNQISGEAGQEHYYTSSFYDVSKITSPSVESGYTKSAMNSFFGRINYKFDERYLITASVRADGSSVLASGHKWGVFPSVAAAWRMTEEQWMKSAHWLNNLKLRASWGLSGNAAVDPYQTFATITSVTSGSTNKIPTSMENPNLTWEKTSAFDVGFDFGVLDNRIYGSIDYYNTRTYDLLYYKSAPATSVFTSVLSNIGKTKGYGIEAAITTVPVRNKEFEWSIDWTYTWAHDEVVELADGLTENIDKTDALIVGQPVSIYYDYELGNCWGVGEFEQYVADYKARGIDFESPLTGYGTPGTLKVIDRNGDGKITTDDKRVYNRSPKHIIGMANRLSWKNWSLNIELMARLGGYIKFEKNTNIGLTDNDANWADINYWTPTNTNTKFCSPGDNSINKNIYSTYSTALAWEKADFLKIKDITLSYNLPEKILKPAHISGVRIYGSLKNFFTIASKNLGGYDPERGGSISFPLSKQVVIGLNLTF